MNAGTATSAIAIAFTVLATASALVPSDASRKTGASSSGYRVLYPTLTLPRRRGIPSSAQPLAREA